MNILSTNNQIYLDLGGALAAFGLIFAVYQLRKPQWDIVLRIRESWQRNLFWIFGGIGLLLTLIGVVLFEFQINYLQYPFDTPLFYEIVAYLFFIASPLSLIYFSTRVKDLFNEKRSKKFYKVMVQEISKTDNERINAVLEILLYNLKNICKAIHTCEGKKEICQLARAILDVILSEESVAKILTTKRLDALKFIFIIVEEYNISRKEIGIGIPKIVQKLFCDKESFLYKHYNSDGLALSSNIYESIFDSSVILKNFDLFGYPTIEFSMRKEMSLSGIEVFKEALSRSIKTYLKTGNVPPRHINNGLSHLSDIFGDLCLKISIEEKRGVDTKYSLKDEWWALHIIAHFLGRDYPSMAYRNIVNLEISEREKTTSEASFYSESTINAGVTAALYKAFEQLSFIKNTVDTYHTVLELLDGMRHESDRKNIEGYMEPFEKRIWEQISNNITKRYYPAVLRPFLSFIGFCLASDTSQRQGWIGEQAEKMRRLLYIDLKPLLDKDAEMVNHEKMKEALLPQTMNYKDGYFTYKFEFGRGKEEIISPPPKGTKSALEGIDLESQSII